MQRIEEQRWKSTSGGAALIEKMRNGEEVQPSEAKKAWARVTKELNDTIRRLSKIHASCGGKLVFFYAPPDDLKRGNDDSNMWKNCRYKFMCDVPEAEADEYFDKEARGKLEATFIAKMDSHLSVVPAELEVPPTAEVEPVVAVEVPDAVGLEVPAFDSAAAALASFKVSETQENRMEGIGDDENAFHSIDSQEIASWVSSVFTFSGGNLPMPPPSLAPAAASVPVFPMPPPPPNSAPVAT